MSRLSRTLILGAVLVASSIAPALATPARLTVGSPWRDGPGTDYAALGNLEVGTRVDLIWCGTRANFCLVERHGKKGWVPLDALNVRPGGGGGTDEVAGSDGKPIPGTKPAAIATEIAPYSPPGGPTFREIDRPSLITKY